MNIQQAAGAFRADRAQLEAAGVHWQPGAEPRLYVSRDPDRGADFAMAYDALPTLSTDPNGGIPVIFTTGTDPEVYEVLFAPNKAAEVLGERQAGTWVEDTRLFPVAEATGETSSYGDYSANGESGVNANWPARQQYLFQTITQWGEREVDRAALAKINIVAEKDKSAALNLSKFLNFTYLFGVRGLQNYGLMNDPNLTASLTPAPKAYGGTAWVSGGVIRATANEIYLDIQSTFLQLVLQANGLVDRATAMTLVLSPQSDGAMTATNSFNVNVADLLKKNFPSIKIVSVPQYGLATAANSQGNAAGNFMQLIATDLEGQRTGFCAFGEKMRAHGIVKEMSAYRQKKSGGSWGAVIRMPIGISSMVGL